MTTPQEDRDLRTLELTLRRLGYPRQEIEAHLQRARRAQDAKLHIPDAPPTQLPLDPPHWSANR